MNVIYLERNYFDLLQHVVSEHKIDSENESKKAENTFKIILQSLRFTCAEWPGKRKKKT